VQTRNGQYGFLEVSLGAFFFLQEEKPMRRIEMAELLAATGDFSVP
jgi:hypothetical protein